LEKNSVFLGRRDKGVKEKQSLLMSELVAQLGSLLDSIQENLLARATAQRAEHTRKIDTKEEFYAYFTPKNSDKPEIHGGFALTHWCGSAAVEEQIKNDLKVTIRCLPFDPALADGSGICPFTGKPSPQRVVFAKAY
jgi:prolyl-tRNA synthetase